MRNRSSKQSNNIGAVDQIDGSVPNYKKLLKEEHQEPHLSGAYIRSLVKQLTSSRTKTTSQINPSKTADTIDQDHHGVPQNLNKFSSTEITHQNPQPQQPKKQVRRRLHTSRPYQERLLNMAEARREIVTALKFHRAAMKQANEQKQQQKQEESSPQESNSQSFPSSSVLDIHHHQQQEESMNSGRNLNPKIYSSSVNTNNYFSSYFDNLSNSTQPNSSIFPWMASSIAPVLPITENFNLPLPNQPLGLNLNFQDFTNLDDTSLYHSNIINNSQCPSVYNSHPSPSSTSSPPMSSVEDALPVAISPEGVASLATTDVSMDSGYVTGGFHPVMDDEEMAAIRSIGEQHQMEWNDRLSFVTSAWWFKFMKTMDIDCPMEKREETLEELDDGFHVFDEIMEFPAWMNNANDEGCFLQQHMDDQFSEDYLQEPALPCMDIEEIEGMDGEWLA